MGMDGRINRPRTGCMGGYIVLWEDVWRMYHPMRGCIHLCSYGGGDGSAAGIRVLSIVESDGWFIVVVQ
jgi:hypothetical protein